MYIRLIISLVSFFFTSFTFSFSNTKKDVSPIINFLSKRDGRVAILDETHEPYFSQLQPKEIEIMVGEKLPANISFREVRNFAKKKFSSSVINFTSKEKKCIEYTIEAIIKILNKKKLFLFTKQPWKLIKTQSWLCGGFAHTRGEYIILSQKHLDYLTSNWKSKMNKTDYKNVILKLGSLLVHEQFHCLQRLHSEKFEKLYTQQWTFKKVSVKSNDYVRTYQLSNPDAPKAEWAFQHDGQLYWSRTLINSKINNPVMGKDLIDLVFPIQQDGEYHKIITDSLNNVNTTRLDSLSSYSNSFPVTRGLDHPNEISAYMFSAYFKSIYLNSKPFNNCNEYNIENTIKFVTWIDQELK